ncbi:MAG: diguanylate cyclase, partial [Actinomycetota bacterium]
MHRSDSLPGFHRAVLEHSPMPLVVVDEAGLVLYGNQAMARLTGIDLDTGRGTPMLDHVHPDDREWVTTAFVELVAGPADHFERGSAWATIFFRMVSADGRVVPIEVTGSGGIRDPEVGGVIYDVRPAWATELLGKILEGLAAGAPLDELLRLIVLMAAVPPLEFDTAALRRDDRTATHRLVASSHPALADALSRLDGAVPWDDETDEPVRHLAAALGTSTPLAEAGYHEVWHVTVPDGERGHLTLLAATRLVDATAVGAVNRLDQARQLASIVLQRARADEALSRAASLDPLTGVLNRLGLMEAASARCREPGACAAIYLDLDGFKPVNDRHGHATGDRVLRAVADRLRFATRSDDLVGRVGGDEFVIVPVRASERAQVERSAHATARRVLDVIAQPIAVDD